MKKSRIVAFIDRIGGDDYANPYMMKLRPTEIALLQALEKHKVIDIRKMKAIDINSVRVSISRLRKKLPAGVTIDTMYGGYYLMSPASKKELNKHRRENHA